MSQTIKITNENKKLLVVSYLNQNIYTCEELKLFTETVCKDIPLVNLKQFIEKSDYNHYLTQEFIYNISMKINTYTIKEITESSIKYHKELFDVMYVKKLEELPLMINGDSDITPVVFWRFKIGK